MRTIIWAAAGGLLLGIAACEPATVTEAREQLQRGRPDTIRLAIPIADDTFDISDFELEGETTIGDLRAIAFVPHTLEAAVAPGLAVAVEEPKELLRGDVDFGDLEDAVQGTTINTGRVQLVVRNTAAVSVVLSDFTLGAVELTASGQVPRDAFGDPVYQTDTQGNPILVPVVDPGQVTLSIPGGDSVSVSLSGPSLLDRIVHLLLDDRRVAVIAAGTATAAAGQPQPGARISLTFHLVVGLDVTLPDTGVVFTSGSAQEGLGLEQQEDIDDLVSTVIRAAAGAIIENETPFGVVVEIAFAAGDLGDVDVFQVPGAVTLDPVTVAASQVNATGRVTQAVTDTAEIAVAGQELPALLGQDFTASVRVRLMPGSGGGGRSALGLSDRIIVHARASVDVERGGGQ